MEKIISAKKAVSSARKLSVLPNSDPKLIYQLLSEHNPDIVVDSNGGIIRYEINETPGKSISLMVLKTILQNQLQRNVRFQRESDEHTNRTAQQIAVDYLTGQFMGYISCYVFPNSHLPKLVIDGKHRLTHLEDFLDGKLKLTGKEASQFWSYHIPWLLSNRENNLEINKYLKKLSEGKIPQVNYPTLDPLFKAEITCRVNIDVIDITVKCVDENGNPLPSDAHDLKKIEEMYYRKFLRINQNSASMKPEDVFWGCGSEYNVVSRSLTDDAFFQYFFKITTDNKQKRKLNEILITTLLFLDGRTAWGSGGGSIVKKINNPDFYSLDGHQGDAIKFKKWYKDVIIPNFTNYLPQTINIPQNLMGIESKGTNIRYMIYFLYLLHESLTKLYAKYPAYANKVPTPFLIHMIELGAKIICSSIKGKNGLTFLPGTNHIYEQYPDIFEKLAEYRRNQRDRKDIDSLFEKIINVCIKEFDPQYSFTNNPL